MQYRKNGDRYIIRIDKGEEIIKTLTEFCKEHEITAGLIHAIGAVEKATIGYYDLEKKEYVFQELSEMMEVTSFTANIALHEEETVVHAHGVFGKQNWETISGHVKEAVVGVTFEAFLTDYGDTLERKLDDEVGLPLIEL